MEKNISITQEDFFNLCNLNNNEAKKEIMLYVRCKSCSIFLEEPLYCIKCNSIICRNCHKNCNNILQKSRHIETIIENVNFKCLYYLNGCEKQLNYIELLKHINKCNKKPVVDFSENLKNIKKNYSEFFENNLNYSKNDNLFFFNIEKNIRNNIINQEKKDKNQKNFLCNSCENMEFDSIEKLIIHKKSNCKENNILNSNNKYKIESIVNEELEVEKLNKSYLEAKKKYFNYIDSIDKNNIQILTKFFDNYNLEFNKKKEKIENLFKEEFELKKNFKDEKGKIKGFDIINILKKDEEFDKLLQEEKNILEKKHILQERLNQKLYEIKKLKVETKNKFEEKYNILDKKLEDLNILEKNLKLKISEIHPNTNIRKYSICGSCDNNNAEIKKIFCEDCKYFFCESCISYCKSDSCKDKKTIICKQKTNKCGICDKQDFCESCLKKCYYTKCENKFCPNCYKRNKHQTRTPDLNCRFFTCDKDNIVDCIMCSLFCQKCELRLCKGCYKKDVDHFSFLKEEKIFK
jgi:hypothetical protein